MSRAGVVGNAALEEALLSLTKPSSPRQEPFWKRPIGIGVIALGGMLLVGGVIVSALEEPPSPPPVSSRGPQPTIACPLGAVAVPPGQSIQSAINANVAGTAFCLLAGVHQVPSPITPKTGNSFTGEFGAVVDGTGTAFTQSYQGLFTAHNQDIDNVTIRNLVIRDSAQRGIHAFRDLSDRWVIDHNEIANNLMGVHVGNGTAVSSNVIHHNVGNPTSPVPAERGGAYGAYRAFDVLWLDNEIAFNGPEQKVLDGGRVTFRGNYVHDNYADGIWYDFGGAGGVVENNIAENNGRAGIDIEATDGLIVRGNTFTRNASADIFLTASDGTDVHGNTINTTRGSGILLFIDVTTGLTLQNNFVHDNTVALVSGRAVSLSCSNLTTADCFSYHTTHGNRFERNIYDVPDPSTAYWFAGSLRTFPQWQALGFDLSGSATSKEVT